MLAFALSDRSPHAGPSRAPAATAELPLCVVTVVSTEEEFDWGGPFRRDATSVEAMRSIGAGQALFERCGVRPTYVVDFPVASQETGFRELREFARDERCEIGAHLHPWVTPPLEEQPSLELSFPGNLPEQLERAKLERLTEVLERNFGVRPCSYQAGRYGFGPRTARALIELGYCVDFSAAPAFDFRRERGPDYTHTPTQPAWLDRDRRLLSVPVSGAFVGRAGSCAARLYGLANSRLGAALKLPGVLARTGMVERIRLSPEGHSPSELTRLAHALVERGDRVLVFSLHSPSFAVGGTPYVRTVDEHRAFFANCEAFYEHMFGALGAVSMTGAELYEALRGRVRAVAAP
jgi:hypothetical protein